MDGMIAVEKWFDVCALNDIPLRGARRMQHQGLTLGVFRTHSGRVFAVDNRCPHKGGPLSDGIVHDTSVTCPLHNWIFDLETGKARGSDDGCIRTFPVEVTDAGRVQIKLPVI